MLHIHSLRRLLLTLAFLALVIGITVALLVSPGSSKGPLVQQILVATAAKPRVLLRETGASTSVRTLDHLTDESSLTTGGTLVYLQKRADLWTLSHDCYFHSTLLSARTPSSFAQDFLPPVGSHATYSQPADNQIDWILALQGTSAHAVKPTQGQVMFDPSTHLLRAATIRSPQTTERATFAYPSAISFPAPPSNLCKSATSRPPLKPKKK